MKMGTLVFAAHYEGKELVIDFDSGHFDSESGVGIPEGFCGEKCGGNLQGNCVQPEDHDGECRCFERNCSCK